MNVDVHWHYVPDAYVQAIRRGDAGLVERVVRDDDGKEWIAIGPGRYPLVPELHRPEAQVAEMRRRRIDLAAVSPSPTLLQYHLDGARGLELHRMVNDEIADLVSAYPERYVGLAAVPLQDTTLAVQELERAMQVKGLRGVEISTHVNGRNLDDASLRPFFRAAADLGAFVFVHPMAVLAPERLSRYYLSNLIGNPTETAIAIASLMFGGVYDECPALTCCFAHGGGSFSALLGRWQHGYEVRTEARINDASAPRDYLPRIYVDSLVHDDRIARLLVDTVGADHVMLGSDMPFDMGAADPVERIERFQGLSADERDKILGATARRLLQIRASTP
jgi:aminocarboxymuconate-semialdehyde decarboxylase